MERITIYVEEFFTGSVDSDYVNRRFSEIKSLGQTYDSTDINVDVSGGKEINSILIHFQVYITDDSTLTIRDVIDKAMAVANDPILENCDTVIVRPTYKGGKEILSSDGLFPSNAKYKSSLDEWIWANDCTEFVKIKKFALGRGEALGEKLDAIES